MNSPNARRLLRFYEQAFGAQLERRGRQNPHRLAARARVQGGAETAVMRLGDSSVELWEFDHPGRPYPPEFSAYDTRFQHLAIVVTDMQRAMERLTATAGWTAISRGGPQRLPAGAGGVIAFKFRDPDGHPLEFLQFGTAGMPAHWRGTVGTGVHLGIDHSALSVADAARSVHFYQSLGMALTSRTLNEGVEQERLDGLRAPVVDVIGLSTSTRPTPHVELLHYRTASRRPHSALHSHDTAATRLLFHGLADARDAAYRLIQDPDGHFLQIGSATAIHPDVAT